ncbi:GNAT family N-acetyltransferase [Deinococcus pimensis]|uniref:GNAT family N-acetyltransferase n=1 Tax=Deinococcus pimensis TaxID=309888 RepID=UPI0004B3CAB6|nr:N-acetyltransferase [Deinococcus pimensis]
MLSRQPDVTPPPTGAPLVRPALAGDLDVIGRIAYLTGYFGESASRYFPDERLFRHLWVNPYYLVPQQVSVRFVADVPGETLGYIVGVTDQVAYERALRFTLLRQVLPNLLRGRYRALPGCVPYLTRISLFPTPHAPRGAYPAHLHLNLLPEARGLGLGRALLTAFVDELRARGVPGVQLSTTAENEAALALYAKAGFEVLAERALPVWTPWLGRPATHVLMGLKL